MQRARVSAASTIDASTKPGAVATSWRPCAAIACGERGALGAVAVELTAQALDARGGGGERGDGERGALLGDQAPGEHDERLGGARGGRLQRPGVLALEHGGLAAQPFGAQAAGVQPREAERALGDARAEALDGLPDAPAERAEVLAPVGGAPDLVPVDDQREAPARCARARRRAARSRGTSRCARPRSGARGAAGARGRRRRTRAAAGSAGGRSRCRAPGAGRP